jgi:hypothetical protein
MARWDPMAEVLLVGSLLSALDKIGIKPTLIGRQTARVLAPMINDIAQKYAEAEQVAKTWDQFIVDYKTAIKNNLNVYDRESFEMNYSKGVLSMNITDCMWLDMLNFGKSMGYKTCAFCGASVFTTALIATLGLGDVTDIRVENKEKVCSLKLVIQEK